MKIKISKLNINQGACLKSRRLKTQIRGNRAGKHRQQKYGMVVRHCSGHMSICNKHLDHQLERKKKKIHLYLQLQKHQYMECCSFVLGFLGQQDPNSPFRNTHIDLTSSHQALPLKDTSPSQQHRDQWQHSNTCLSGQLFT